MMPTPVPLPAAAAMSDLFTPLTLGDLELPNRVIHAPLTRCRADDDNVPGPLVATYYAQRASAGLLIAEATMVMEGNSAFWHEPGIHSRAQVEGWQRTTDAVQCRRRAHRAAALARRPGLPSPAQRRPPAGGTECDRDHGR